jgi:hypothetical protein
MVVPSSRTLAGRLLSSGVISRPPVTLHSRAVKYSGVTPRMLLAQFDAPTVSCARVYRSGATAATPGISSSIARASYSLSRGEAPLPSRTLVVRALPGLMLMRLAPRLRI